MVVKTRRVGHAHTLPTAPAYSFGGKLAKPTGPDTPGPGEYVVTKDFDNGKGGFGTSTRDAALKAASPSAQEYNLESSAKLTMRSSANYTLHGTPRPDHRNNNPGPGTYDGDVAANRVKPNIAVLTISSKLPQHAPGESTPSPAEYSPKSPKDARKLPISLKFRPSGGGNGVTPGPGEYGVPKTWNDESPGKSFGGSRPSPRHENGSPGPGTYNPDDPVVLQRPPAWTLGPKLNRSRSPDVPGPGTYSHEPFVQGSAGRSVRSEGANAPTWTMGGRRPPAGVTSTPAGTDYRPTDGVRKSAPAFSFRGVKAKEEKAWVPGPGTYEHPADNPTHPYNPKITVSSKLESPGAARMGPGPQAYELPKTSPTKPAASMKFRHSINVLDPGPGPGEYQPAISPTDIQSKGKGFTFRQRLPYEKREAVPGPVYQVGCSTLGVAAREKMEESVMEQLVVL